MKIVVLVKEVPDTYGDRHLNLETGLAERGESENVLDEIAERSLELAISYAEKNPGTETVAISMGPGSVSTSLRKALAMGADRAVHVLDDRLLGADVVLTAEVLAATVKRVGFDLVIAGNISTDGTGGVVPSAVAELLAVPQLTSLTSVEISASAARGTRATDDGVATVSAHLPAVVSITEALPGARLPNFKGIMAAKKKPFETIGLADLNVDADNPAAPRSILLAVSQKPPRSAGVKIVDDGTAAEQLADFLAQNRLV